MSIEEIKAYRVAVDTITLYIGQLKRTRETSLAYTSSQLAKMWLGKTLKELGNSTPYPESKNPSNSIIEPTADTADEDGLIDFSSDIEQIKYIRLISDNLAEEIYSSAYDQGSVAISILNSYKSLQEACMWLGMELGRIRDTQ